MSTCASSMALTNRSDATPARPVARGPARAAVAPHVPGRRRDCPRRGRRPVLLVLPAALIEEQLGVKLANVRSPLAAELDPGELILGGHKGERPPRDAHARGAA